MSTIWVSWVVIVVNPLSACMLAYIIMHWKQEFCIGWITRMAVASLAVTLLMQAAGHVALLTHYREPRSLLWIPQILSLNSVIWSAFFRTGYIHQRKWKDGNSNAT